MRTTNDCINCGKYIPTRISIDGKTRYLKNRTKCFDCSPFRQVGISVDKICTNCGKVVEKQVVIDGKAYYPNKRKVCLTCVPFTPHKVGRKELPEGIVPKTMFQYANWPKERKQEWQRKVAEKGTNRKNELVNLYGGKCIKCGYSGPLRCMSFHHRMPSEKTFTLDSSTIRGKKWELVLNEANKCDLLCIRCHGEIEDEIITNKTESPAT
jgi:hypothetical protein